MYRSPLARVTRVKARDVGTLEIRLWHARARFDGHSSALSVPLPLCGGLKCSKCCSRAHWCRCWARGESRRLIDAVRYKLVSRYARLVTRGLRTYLAGLHRREERRNNEEHRAHGPNNQSRVSSTPPPRRNPQGYRRCISKSDNRGSPRAREKVKERSARIEEERVSLQPPPAPSPTPLQPALRKDR